MPENCKTVVIKWSTGSMECIVDMFGGFPLAKLRKLILPYMATGCSPEDKFTILEYLSGEYSAAMEREKISDAKNLYTRITEICTACGLDIPADITEPKENKPDYNYKINYNKLAIVGSIPAPDEIKRFEVGKTYQTRSICNNECIISITVTARTDKTITVIEHGETKRLRINEKSTEYHKAETVYPWGHYSMAPQIHADEVVNPEPPAPDPDDNPDKGSEPETELTSYSKITIDYDYINNLIQSAKPENESPAEEITAAPEDQTPPAPAPERPKAKRRAAPDWVGKPMTAYPKKPKKPEWIGRKMVITIGERYARPAGA